MVSNGTVGGSEHRGTRSGGVGGPNNIVESVTSVAGTTKGLSHLTAVVKGSGRRSRIGIITCSSAVASTVASVTGSRRAQEAA